MRQKKPSKSESESNQFLNPLYCNFLFYSLSLSLTQSHRVREKWRRRNWTSWSNSSSSASPIPPFSTILLSLSSAITSTGMYLNFHQYRPHFIVSNFNPLFLIYQNDSPFSVLALRFLPLRMTTATPNLYSLSLSLSVFSRVYHAHKLCIYIYSYMYVCFHECDFRGAMWWRRATRTWMPGKEMPTMRQTRRTR